MFIVGNIISCLLWGVVIAIVVMAIVLFLVKGFVNKNFTPLSWCMAFVMTVLLAIQSTLMVGAIKAKDMVVDIQDVAASMIQTAQNKVSSQSGQTNMSDWLDELKDEYPFIDSIVDIDELQEKDPDDIVEIIGDEVDSYLNWYIARRVGWSSAFLVVGVGIMVKTAENFAGGNRNRRKDFRKPIHSRRGTRKHIH